MHDAPAPLCGKVTDQAHSTMCALVPLLLLLLQRDILRLLQGLPREQHLPASDAVDLSWPLTAAARQQQPQR
jgi:hypothetical protein